VIECVSIPTLQAFAGNPIADQHRLRQRVVIDKLKWQHVYSLDGEMEFDRYDNLSTEYLVYRTLEGTALGVIRSNPTIFPCMLTEEFEYLVAGDLECGPAIHEASRIVVDATLTKAQRTPIVDELLVALLERGLQRNLRAYVGFMLDKIWASTFRRVGWEPAFLGPLTPLRDGTGDVQAARLAVDDALRVRLAETTGIVGTVLNFGTLQAHSID
jgi:N-acyl-L-homoserine lactone synthetase